MSESEAVERNKRVSEEATRRLKAIAGAPTHAAGTARDAVVEGQVTADNAVEQIAKRAETGKQMGEKLVEGKVPGVDANEFTPESNSETTWNSGAFGTSFPMMNPSGVPEPNLGVPLQCDYSDNRRQLSGVEAICNATEIRGPRR